MKKAVIIGVGAEQGLGSQLAKRFASEGLHVFIAGRTLSRVQERASEIEQTGGEATAVCADASDKKGRSSSFSKKPEVNSAWQFTMPETIFLVKLLTWTQTTLKTAGNHAATAVSCLDVKHCAAWFQLAKELYSLLAPAHL
ncbi:MAG: hypothetical protein Ct9H300mP28_27270 [Pseudomonadota bacterium]|nr:MAG: hypothetical protein Ct9H300mP28_27270 [Pseudomonadota bacterium]